MGMGGERGALKSAKQCHTQFASVQSYSPPSYSHNGVFQQSGTRNNCLKLPYTLGTDTPANVSSGYRHHVCGAQVRRNCLLLDLATTTILEINLKWLPESTNEMMHYNTKSNATMQ